MSHPEITNNTPFAAELMLLEDGEGVPLACTLVKATFALSEDGPPLLAESQRSVCMRGEHYGEPGTSSVKYEPEVAFHKPTTDVVLIGHAVARTTQTTQMAVRLKVGGIDKTVRVTGDRRWEVGRLGSRMTPPAPFDRVALVWENAFGGRERSPLDPGRVRCEPRNPLGKGYWPPGEPPVSGLAVPNLEYPDDPLLAYHDRVRPAGFGFTCPHWEPRAGLSGTYDETWLKERAPLLATDFQLRHLQAAPHDQVCAAYLAGNEPVEIIGTTERGAMRFSLPRLSPPRVALRTRDGDRPPGVTRLDTLILDTDALEMQLLYRVSEPLRRGVHELRALTIECDGAPERRLPGPPPSKVTPIERARRAGGA